MFKVGDRVSVSLGRRNAPATVVQLIGGLCLTVFDDPTVGHDDRWTTKGSWLSLPRSLSFLEENLDYEVDE